MQPTTSLAAARCGVKSRHYVALALVWKFL
jgi:hypothetical protein